ncbi:hypothetical protein HHL19_10190 [Streptomyces sp. R302]|uniref:hypothetical protein n=1 Tax=unclassified Streptomyces TaxID=2593676 RepID=UPI00145D4442|nr:MULTISPECIES: hypothetical protein [unclassified Streptomyces]NML50037.1 hypothetical protein [Streptomyces sp. R301]NML79028.1 hypothetical protein [Streptomyces sp. R302]
MSHSPSPTTPTTPLSLLALLAALACAEIVLVTGDASDGVRYGGGAVLLAAILAVVHRIAKAR